MQEPHRPIEILMVDDSPADVDLTREAFQEARVLNHLVTVDNGADALRLLFREEPYPHAARPDLILLDLNMPRLSGLELLKVIKSVETLKSIPVVVLTSSQAEKDIAQSYQLHANAYVVKPVDFETFMQVIKAIEGFWLAFVKLPPRAR